MKLLYSFCFLIFGFVASGQKPLMGIVVNAGNNGPLPNATVFLNGTSIGVKTNELGNFSIRIPPGKYDLVVIFPGFETYSEIIDSYSLKDSVIIHLETKSEVKRKNYQTYRKSNWELSGELFVQNFIGTSINAHFCKIKNVKAIHFYISDQTGQLIVSADEPLIIQNEAMGYTILYKLEWFYYNFYTFSHSFAGYSFFQYMEGSKTKQKIWEQVRSEAYFGSLMHFMRSVFLNRITEEGFEVRSLRKVLNIPVTQTNQQLTNGSNLSKAIDSNKVTKQDADSANNYVDQILNADNYKDIIGVPLPGDSIAYALDKHTAALDFSDFLLVIYREKEAPADYQEQYNGTSMTSQLILQNGKAIEIEANGSYNELRNLGILGYWAWAQKIANLLPFNYTPPETK